MLLSGNFHGRFIPSGKSGLHMYFLINELGILYNFFKLKSKLMIYEVESQFLEEEF